MVGNMLNDLAEAIRRWTEKKAVVATTWAMPMSPIISKGDTKRVKDLDRVSPTVIRPRQSSVSLSTDLSHP